MSAMSPTGLAHSATAPNLHANERLQSSASHNALTSLFTLSGHSRQTSHGSPTDFSPNGHPNTIKHSASHLFNSEPSYHYPCNSDSYDVISEIGVGAFATVYRAVCKENNEEVAVKVIDLDQFNTNWEEIRNEIMIMCQLHHPNIVRIKASFVDNQDLWIVMPLLHAGSCASLIKQFYPTGFKDEALIATILRDTLLGLIYLHKDNRIHRDLKAGNILIGKGGEVELADFGVTGTLMENGDRAKNRQTFTGTPCWMAPEVMEHSTGGYDQHADIWSFGITAMELAYGRAPYARFQPMKVMLLTLQEEPPTAEIYRDNSYQFSAHFHSMVGKCLRKDPKKRPTARKLFEHKFFRQARDSKYIYEKIVSKLPRDTKLNEKRVHICKEKTLHDADREMKSKPISIVGSWNFGEAGLTNLKQQAAKEEQEEKARQAQHIAAVDASYEAHSPRGGTPLTTNAHSASPQSPQSPASPNEHREGRFVVSDEEAEHSAVHIVGMNGLDALASAYDAKAHDINAHIQTGKKHEQVNEELPVKQLQASVGRFSVSDA